MSIGKKIRFFRKKKNISQSDLAINICSVSYLSKIENDQVVANPEIIEKLIARLQINLEIHVDTQKLLSMLTNWNRNIINHKRLAADKTYKRLEMTIKATNDPFHILKFKILELHYLIFIEDYERASLQITDLNQYEDLLEGELKFYFYKIKGLYLYRINHKHCAINNYCKAMEFSSSSSLQDWEKAYLYYLLSFVAHEIVKIRGLVS